MYADLISMYLQPTLWKRKYTGGYPPPPGQQAKKKGTLHLTAVKQEATVPMCFRILLYDKSKIEKREWT